MRRELSRKVALGSAPALLALGALAVGVGAPSLGGTGNSFLGQKAPEIQVGGWLNGDGLTQLADHAGEVVVLEFWSTHCAPCRGSVKHLCDLQAEYGDKGLHVIAINNEEQDIVRRYLLHQDPSFNYKIGLGGGGAYGVTGIPHAYLIGPDGTVAWEGAPSSLPKKDLEGLLKQVAEPTAEQKEARAGKALEWAKTFSADGQVWRAHEELEGVADRFRGTDAAAEAKELAKELESADHAAELAAQKQIAKLVGGFEHPAEKLKDKQLAAASKKLTKLADSWTESAPRASALARQWVALLDTPWE